MSVPLVTRTRLVFIHSGGGGTRSSHFRARGSASVPGSRLRAPGWTLDIRALPQGLQAGLRKIRSMPGLVITAM